MNTLVRLCCIGLIFLSTIVSAATSTNQAIPKDLKPWVPWVSKHLDFLECPLIEGGAPTLEQHRICAWPSTLQLTVSNTRGQFEQNWKVYKDSWIPLPGNRDYWPEMVQVNGTNAAIVEKANRPHVFIKKGTVKLVGFWIWQSQPEELQLPAFSSRVVLTMNGQNVPFPEIENQSLYLGEKQSAQNEVETLDIQVYRLLTDGHPIQLETRVSISVSGAAREITLGKALPDDFRLIHLQSDIPAMIDQQGELILQAKPGEWQLSVFAFTSPSTSSFQFAPNNEKWPTQEIWSYQQNSNVRVTTLENLSVVDPNQVVVPNEWRSFLAYLLTPTDNATINEKFRGIPDGDQNRLNLQRSMWLAFDGSGWRFEDRIAGDMRVDWRLDMAEPYTLQFAEEDGENLLVTRTKENNSGVELRYPRVNVAGGGEIALASQLPIAGWQTPFTAVDWTVHLPPAHRLLFVTGAEKDNSWIEGWNLWNIFWVLLLSVIAFKYTDRWVALSIFVATVLMFHENGSPVTSLSNLLFAFALFQNTKTINASWVKVIKGYLYFALVIFVFNLGLFFIHQVRVLIHPQLEHMSPVHSLSAGMSNMYQAEQSQSAAMVSTPRSKSTESRRDRLEEKVVVTGSRIRRVDTLNRYQSDMALQTGLGKLSWRWNDYSVGWHSPVTAEQTVNLWIANPTVMVVWRLLMLLGLLATLVLMLRKTVSFADLAKFNRPSSSASSNYSLTNMVSIAVLLSCSSFMTNDVHANTGIPDKDMPSQSLLNELRDWVHRPAECSPQCVTIQQLEVISERPNELTLVLTANAEEDTAFTIPQAKEWFVNSIVVDNQSNNWLANKNNAHWIFIKKGTRKIQLKGMTSGASSISLTFDELPFNVTNRSALWELEGVKNGALFSNQLNLIRKSRTGSTQTNASQKDLDQSLGQSVSQTVKPMVRVVRELTFENQWMVDTRVERIAPRVGAVNVDIQLLPFEKVVTLGADITDQTIRVQIPSGEESIQWRSRVPVLQSSLQLTAAEQTHWLEEWILVVSHQWHVDVDGVPQIWPRYFDSNDLWTFRYLPRVGESITIKIDTPKAIPGFSQSFDHVSIELTSGAQQQSIALNGSYRSTRGGQGSIQSDDGTQLQAFINGQQSYLQIQNGEISYPILPGTHSLQFNWKRETPLSWKTSFPEIDFGAPLSNITLKWQVPNRWVLWTSGPTIGPAIIYWGELLAFLAIALAFWRFKILPVNPVHWLVLGLGLSTQSWWLLVLTTLWWLSLQSHKMFAKTLSDTWYNFVQVLMTIFSAIIALSLIIVVPFSLLSSPDMGITGNYSSDYLLNWYQDSTQGAIPSVTIYSAPMWFYKALMLLWALWLSFSLVKWGKLAWQVLSENGYWRTTKNKIKQPKETESKSADSQGEKNDDMTEKADSIEEGSSKERDN